MENPNSEKVAVKNPKKVKTLTKKLILVVSSIMLILGLGIWYVKIFAPTSEYKTAARIEKDEGAFRLGMETSDGKTVVKGDLKVLTSVGITELKKRYGYIEREEERLESDSDDNLDWNRQTPKVFYPEEIEFLGVPFNGDQIKAESFLFEPLELTEKTVVGDYIHQINGTGYLKTDSYTRYSYSVLPKEINNLVIYADLGGGTINSAKMLGIGEIEQVIEDAAVADKIIYSIFFWILWALATILFLIVLYFVKKSSAKKKNDDPLAP